MRVVFGKYLTIRIIHENKTLIYKNTQHYSFLAVVDIVAKELFKKLSHPHQLGFGFEFTFVNSLIMTLNFSHTSGPANELLFVT